MILWLLLAIIGVFLLTVFRGAPYVPTHSSVVEKALDLLPLEQGEVVVDLGSGDGAFLKAAAKRGIKAVGYEINPVLCAVSWFRCWQYRNLVDIRLRDFWLSSLPNNTKAIFVFLATPYMKRLAKKLATEINQRNEPLWVLSYGFKLPGFKPSKTQGALYLYKLTKKR